MRSLARLLLVAAVVSALAGIALPASAHHCAWPAQCHGGEIPPGLNLPTCTAEDGLQSVPVTTTLGQPVSHTIHTRVEPLLGVVVSIPGVSLQGLVHQVNCGIVAPAEDVIDMLLFSIVF